MKKLIFLVCSFLLVSCAPTLRYVKESKPASTKIPSATNPAKINSVRVYGRFDALETSTATASYYADEFNGKKTADGEIFDMNDLTAAHTSYPFNTICRVTNLKNQKSVIVRINDRKPNTNNRVIDLSLGAAKEIDMINDGLAEVKVEILKWGEE